MTAFKLDLSKLADDELPKPFWMDGPEENGELKIGIHIHPQFDEIIAEMKRRNLELKDNKFIKKT